MGFDPFLALADWLDQTEGPIGLPLALGTGAFLARTKLRDCIGKGIFVRLDAGAAQFQAVSGIIAHGCLPSFQLFIGSMWSIEPSLLKI